jgi:DNA-binding NarL/FixJ family response regulator
MPDGADMLEPLGLNEIDSAVYRLLFRYPSWEPDRIAIELAVAPSWVQDSLARLLDRGLVKQDPRTPAGVAPLGPDLVLDALLAEDEARIAQHRQQIARLRAELSALVDDYLATRTEVVAAERIERVDGVNAVRLRIEELARQTTQEVLSLHPDAAQSTESIEASLPLDRRALQRGVTMRAIYLHEIVADDSTWRYVLTLARYGAEIRTSSAVPARLMIIDRRVALVPADQDASGGSALVIRGSGIITALIVLFHQCWRSARPLETEQAKVAPGTVGEEDTPSERDRLLLRLLSLGLKDEAIARHLGVSIRTVRRHIGEVFERLDASSRFQAGVQAAARGWITDADKQDTR